MGNIKQGILGGFSGKVGSVVGTSWKGVAVMKAKPLSVANPKTPAQVQNRNRQTYLLMFAQAISTEIIRLLWNRGALKMSGFNRFMSINKNVFDGNGNYNLNEVVFSEGKLTPVATNIANVHTGATTITVNFDTELAGNQSSTDVAFMIVVRRSDGRVIANGYGTQRLSGQVTGDVIDAFTVGDALEAFVGFRSQDGTLISNATNSTTVVVA
jgi:hypothetical protein